VASGRSVAVFKVRLQLVIAALLGAAVFGSAAAGPIAEAIAPAGPVLLADEGDDTPWD
jgi:hypothetical protein